MNEARYRPLSLALVVLTAVAMFALRLAGPPNLMDDDQERPASYVLDAIQNGHWAVQYDWMGGVSSKPPLYTWLAALAILPLGRISYFSLYLPAFLSVLITAYLVLRTGGSRFGPPAGVLAAVTFLVSPIMSRQIALARTDALFMLAVTLAALAAFDAWSRGTGWVRFWLLAALVTLAKGPLGVALAAGGLCAGLWERTGRPRGPAPREHAVGVLLCLALTLGWFALAYREAGQVFIDRVLKRELVGHLVAGDKGEAPLKYFYEPALYFLHRFAPWSVAACAGFWRVLRRPAVEPGARRFERFLFGWFFVGLLIFSLAPHQRADLLSPIIPPAALLGGRELARWLARIALPRQMALAAAAAAVMLGVNGSYYLTCGGDIWVQRTVGMERLAREIREKAGDALLVHVDTPYTLQFYLNTMRTLTPPEEAARLLMGSNRVCVAACDFSMVEDYLPGDFKVREVARWPGEGEAFISVFSNQ